MENNFDKDQIPYPKYKSGDKVWIERWDGNIKQGEIENVKHCIFWNHYNFQPTFEIQTEYSIDYGCGSKSSYVQESEIFTTYEECKASVDNKVEIQRLRDIDKYTKELRQCQMNVELYTERLEKLKNAKSK